VKRAEKQSVNNIKKRSVKHYRFHRAHQNKAASIQKRLYAD